MLTINADRGSSPYEYAETIGHLAAAVGRVVLERDRGRAVGVGLAGRFMYAVVIQRCRHAARIRFAG